MTKKDLIDHFVALGIKFRENSNLTKQQIKLHVLYLSDCAVKSLPENFIERVIEIAIKTDQEIPTDILKVKENDELMSAFNIGFYGTTNDEIFLNN